MRNITMHTLPVTDKLKSQSLHLKGTKISYMLDVQTIII